MFGSTGNKRQKRKINKREKAWNKRRNVGKRKGGKRIMRKM